MNVINNMVSKTSEKIFNGLEVITFAVTHNEPLEKVAKITGRILTIAEVVFSGLSKALSNFQTQLTDTIVVFESLRFIGAANIILVPKNGKYFLTDPANSWQKRLDRVNLFFHTAFKSYKGLNKFGFASLGVMSKEVIGKLPIFTLTMDSFMLGSCFFSLWDNIGINLPNARQELEKANRKIDKWESRPTEIAYLKANFENECTLFETRCQAKVVDLHAKLEDLEKQVRLNDDKLLKASDLPKKAQEKTIADCTAESIKLTKEIEKIHAKQQKVEGQLSKIAVGNFRGVAEDLEKKDVIHKLKKWEVCKANAQQDQAKIWLKVANAVAKFSAIILALTLVALNVWTAPTILALAIVGGITDSIGLTKILAEEFWKPKAIPTKFAAV